MEVQPIKYVSEYNMYMYIQYNTQPTFNEYICTVHMMYGMYVQFLHVQCNTQPRINEYVQYMYHTALVKISP